MPTDYLLVAVSALLLASVLGSKASGRLGIPALLLFLLMGMLVGSDGPGGFYFDDTSLAQSIGVVALALILFSGGLDTSWGSVRPVFRQGLLLSTVGVFLTALAVGAMASVVLGFSLVEGLLLGAIVSSTDAAAVFSVLRSRNVKLRGKLESLLELESGSNDPMAVFLTVGFTSLLASSTVSGFDLVLLFFQQMGLGLAIGFVLGRATVLMVNRSRLEYDGLYPVLTLSSVLLTYGATVSLGGNGFLAVYIAGLVMGNHKLIHKKSLLRFHDGLAWLMQIAMFLTLGLLVFPSKLPAIALTGLVVSGFLMLVARPVSVFLSMSFSGFSFREKTLVSWVGLRGAVPIILATFPLVAGVPRADTMFDLVFFIVLASTLLQGTSIPWVARWLRVEAPPPAPPLSLETAAAAPACSVTNKLVELVVPARAAVAGQRVMDLAMPEGTLIVLISRANECLIPNGGSVVEEGDTLLLFGQHDVLEKVRPLLERPRASKKKDHRPLEVPPTA